MKNRNQNHKNGFKTDGGNFLDSLTDPLGPASYVHKKEEPKSNWLLKNSKFWKRRKTEFELISASALIHQVLFCFSVQLGYWKSEFCDCRFQEDRFESEEFIQVKPLSTVI